MRDLALHVHAEGLIFQAREHHQSDHSPEVQLMLGDCLLSGATEGNTGALQQYLESLQPEARALYPVLQGLALAATYTATRRDTLRRVWPTLMDLLLPVLESDGEHPADGSATRPDEYDQLIAAFLPVPRVRLDDDSPAALFASAQSDWLDPQEFAPLVRRWLRLARGRAACLTSLLGFLHTTPVPFQAQQGFDWIVELIDGQYEQFARRAAALLDWLTQLQATQPLAEPRRKQYQLLVDGLAAHGDAAAVRLQQAME